MKLQKQMFKELEEKKIFDQARTYSFDYANNIDKMDVFPSDENHQKLSAFDEPLPQNTTCLLYTSPSPRDATLSRMPSSA